MPETRLAEASEAAGSRAILSEEAHLRKKFGDECDTYTQRRAAPMQRSFSWQRAMANREYNAMAGVAAVLAVLAAKLYFLT